MKNLLKTTFSHDPSGSNIRFLIRALVTLIVAFGVELSVDQLAAVYLTLDAALRVLGAAVPEPGADPNQP